MVFVENSRSLKQWCMRVSKVLWSFSFTSTWFMEIKLYTYSDARGYSLSQFGNDFNQCVCDVKCDCQSNDEVTLRGRLLARQTSRRLFLRCDDLPVFQVVLWIWLVLHVAQVTHRDLLLHHIPMSLFSVFFV